MTSTYVEINSERLERSERL
jgi:hypothetical protein